ncbi:hypothetical protein Asi02nite_80520 [Asanoa siamensis]|uniref:Secreted protein n=1 Tax=Asanoa siamensis TaxID=926357 RepID=A0ABQ4D4T1_9ACTN|nr:hypothetical protein Asi02nite_80520 [Asanoa siamensis]
MHNSLTWAFGFVLQVGVVEEAGAGGGEGDSTSSTLGYLSTTRTTSGKKPEQRDRMVAAGEGGSDQHRAAGAQNAPQLTGGSGQVRHVVDDGGQPGRVDAADGMLATSPTRTCGCRQRARTASAG